MAKPPTPAPATTEATVAERAACSSERREEWTVEAAAAAALRPAKEGAGAVEGDVAEARSGRTAGAWPGCATRSSPGGGRKAALADVMAEWK